MCTETFPAKTLAKLYDKVTGNNAEPPTADAKGWEMLSTSIGQADVFPLFSKIPLKRTPRISSPGTGDTDSHETSSAHGSEVRTVVFTFKDSIDLCLRF